MGRAPAILLLLLVALLPLQAGARESKPAREPTERMVLKVGKPVLWSPGYACMMIVCDDPSVVKVEDARTELRLTGLRPGRTKCGFWRDQAFRRVITMIVKR